MRTFFHWLADKLAPRAIDRCESGWDRDAELAAEREYLAQDSGDQGADLNTPSAGRG